MNTLQSNTVIAAVEIDRYILIDKLESKIPTLQAASQISLSGHALILGAVDRKPSTDFTGNRL